MSVEAMPNTSLFDGVQVMYDPVTKEVMMVRQDKVILVPGKHGSYSLAYAACKSVLQARYPDLSG